MGLRKIRILGQDAVLRKTSRPVHSVSRNIHMLIRDMADTMAHGQGVGLAAPQVGILRRIIVLNAGQGLIRLINPVIVNEQGEQTGLEGCLSIPGFQAMVRRPDFIIVEALDEEGAPIRLNGQGLLARILCHEIDHLDGILYIDKAEPGTLMKNQPKT